MDLALLLVRLILGLGIAAHGAQKLFGWFGGPGLAGAGGFVEQAGYRPGRLFALAGSLGEFLGGALLVLGLFGALGPAMVVSVMLTAILTFHIANGFFTSKNGWELAALYVAGAIALAFAGFGAYSLDAVWHLGILTAPSQAWIALGVAALAAALNQVVRRRPAAQAVHTPSKAA